MLVVVIPNGYNWESILGLLNLSLTWPINARGDIDISSRREWSKKHALSLSEGSALSPAQTQGRQDALFHGQGRSQFGARSVLPVREHGKLARTPLAAFFNIPLKEKRLSGPIKPHNLISSVKYYTMNQIIYALMLHGLLKFF